MTESIITIAVAGFLAGLIFSMPIAGPISILISSNALKGRSGYCAHVNIGASFATFTYVFFAAYGLTKLFPFYKPAIPYLLAFGSVFLLFLGYKIFRTKIDIDHIEDKSHLSEMMKKKDKRGFYTGFMINLFNPTLFIGWLTSTFFVISFIASFGFNTGGLSLSINNSVKEISNYEESVKDDLLDISPQYLNSLNKRNNEVDTGETKDLPKTFHLLISLIYALFITAGSVIWYYILIFLITRFRKAIKTKILTDFIKFMGIILCCFGIYFAYLSTRMLLHLH